MFPIRDHNPSGRTPYVTYLLLVANIAIFLSYVGLFSNDSSIGQFFLDWALVPRAISEGVHLHGIVTSMFLHGGWMHLAGNMLFLWIFGDNIEDELGHFGFVLFYLACGVLSAATHILANPLSVVPTVGASGAIAGLMGGYLLMFPKARVDILVILIVFFRIFPIPAWIMLMLWLGMQFIGGFTNDPDLGGVAYWAHIGGFVAGLILILPLWLMRGGPQFWHQTHGHPPHPEAKYPIQHSSIPKVRRK